MGGKNLPFSFGVVASEIGQNIERVASVAHELGMTTIDVNSVSERPIIELSDSEVESVKATFDRYGLSTGMITGPFAKKLVVDDMIPSSLFKMKEFQDEITGLRRAFQVARKLGTRYVRTFSFKRTQPEGIPERILEVAAAGLQEVARQAGNEGITLLLENVRSCWADTGFNSAQLLSSVDMDNLRLAWDPANAFVSGERVIPDGYNAARPYMDHFHIKDAQFLDRSRGITEWARIGLGEADCRRQIKALLDDNYSGVVVVETHWSPEGLTKEEATRKSFAGLAQIVNSLGGEC